MTHKSSNSSSAARTLTWLAILLAVIIVLQAFASSIKIGALEFSLTLVPIVLGAMILGPWQGAFLGLMFGVMTLIAGITGASPFTNVLFADHPVLTSLTCLVKGTAAGLGAGLVYRLVRNRNKYVATFIASATAPILNTGLFIVGAFLMKDTFSGMASSNSVGLVYFIFIGCAGLNFIVEFFVNMVVSPAIYRVSEIIERRKY